MSHRVSALLRLLTTALLSLSLIALIEPTLPTATAQADEPWKIAKKSFSHHTAGYLSKVSILAGSPLQAFVTCRAKSFELEYFRMGYYDGAGALSVGKTDPQPCTRQVVPVRESNYLAIKAHWINPVSIDTTNFEPGIYLIKIWASDGTAAFMPLVIRSPSVAGAVVIAMPDLTSLAYNQWGGASAYSAAGGFENRARNLSFDLPFQDGFGSGIFLNYLNPLLTLATQMNLNLAYVSDVDVATIPGLLKGAMSYVSAGHDEYWTQEERDAVLKARSEGTNLLFFGANVSYWRIRLTGGSDTTNPDVSIYKSSANDPDKSAPTIRFRDTGAHEETLTGLKYRCFPASGNFTVKNPDSFVFAGTGVKKGDSFPGLIGPEVDAFNGAKYFPGELSIIASTAISCGHVVRRNSHSEMSYGVDPKTGAATIAVGTMDWVMRGLSREAPAASSSLAIKMTENILRAANVGPIGLQYPIAASEVER